MAALTIRGLDDDLKQRLRVLAAKRGSSMEATARDILAEAVRADEPAPGLFSALLDAAQELGGIDLDIPLRTDLPRHPDFDA